MYIDNTLIGYNKVDIKDVLILCDVSRTTESRMDTAFELAAVYDAAVTAVFIPPSPQVHANRYHSAAVLSVPIEEQLEHTSEAIKYAKHTFISKAKKLGVAYEWIEDQDIDIHTFISYSRFSDLAITPQLFTEHIPNAKTRISDYLSTHIGKALIILPNKKKKFSLLNNVVVAWNESPQAARAVHDSIPLLKHAKEIHVIMVPEEDGSDKHLFISGQSLKSYLSHHGINVKTEIIKRTKPKIAENILTAAKSHRVDLIVMGVYGHSRFQESVFGGTSKHLLKYSTIPLLVSH